MKRTKITISCIFLFILLFSCNVFSQFVNIPDSSFRQYLMSIGLSPAFNGNNLDTTNFLVQNTNNISCTGLEIQSIEGVQFFKNLTTLDCSINYLTALPSLPNSLLSLLCKKNLLASLPILPPNLTDLVCENNSLTALPSIPAEVRYINCRYNRITQLPFLPNSLTVLLCDSNFISSITNFPPALQEFSANENFIDSLPTLPATLRHLVCLYNNIRELPALPDSLTTLAIEYNPISSLPNPLPINLTTLTISRTKITSIPPLPGTLKTLTMRYDTLTSLPYFPNSITNLDATGCNLSSFPQIPTNIQFLNVNANNLTSLPNLPSSLTSLHCSLNFLSSIPSLPPNLYTLACSGNNISVLPTLPQTLKQLWIDDNPIQFIPQLSDSLEGLNISHTLISCLPTFKTINFFYWQNSNITCLPNIINVVDAYPLIDTLPLCQPSSGCDISWNISGSIYHDLNNDCLQDTNEQSLKNIPVLLDSAGVFIQSCFTNANGEYSFRAPLGNYSVRINPTNIPVPFSCPPSGLYTTQLTPTDSIKSNLNFALSCPNAFDLYAGSITPETMFRPTRTIKVFLNAGDLFGNFGTSCYDSAGFVSCNFSGPITYVSPSYGALTPTVISPTTLRWNINDFSVVDPSTDFNIEVLVDSFASINSSICFQLSIFPFIGDIFPFNNTRSACFPVRNSIDPNEKYMYPSGSVDTSDHVFNFTVFFQNSGNAPAEDIFILDTIDNDLDISTFEFVSSTHPVITQILPGNIIRFNFPGINLIDSVTNESQSHGHVDYRISRKQSTGMGTEITNTAYIYFDQNPPIATNTVSAIVTSIVGIKENNISDPLIVYPNPTKGLLKIMSLVTGNGKIEITNLLGEKVKIEIFKNGAVPSLDISNLDPGLYIISLFDQLGRRSERFLKQ